MNRVIGTVAQMLLGFYLVASGFGVVVLYPWLMFVAGATIIGRVIASIEED